MASEVLLPPLARITPQDQRGVLWIIATICLAFVYLTFAARAFVRWQRFQPDDYAILAACVLVLAQTSVSYAAVGLGLGHSGLTVDEDDIQTVWRVSSSHKSPGTMMRHPCPSAHMPSAFHCERSLVRDCDFHGQGGSAPDYS